MFYGYFLSGSGSATYVRNLTQSLNKIGQDVILFSQEKNPENFLFISQAFQVINNKLSLQFKRSTPFKGKTIHIKADLEGFLPVYVYNPYKDYKKVKEFKDINLKELNFYFEKLKKAILFAQKNGVLKDIKGIISHHIFPLPFLLQEVFPKKTHLAVFHGTDLNYAVLKNPIWLKYFEEKPKNFTFIIASNHGKYDLLKLIPKNLIEKQVKIINPGVDTSLFSPAKHPTKNLLTLQKNLENLLQNLKIKKILSQKEATLKKARKEKNLQKLIALWDEIYQYENLRLPGVAFLDFLKNFDPQKPTLVYCGALNWAKGGQFLMLALPFIFERFPDLQVVFVGSGELRGFFESFKSALGQGDFKFLKKIIEIAEAKESSSKQFPLSLKDALKENQKLLKKKTLKKVKNITFAGFLEHENLSLLFGLADAFVGPSILPESFGMTAIEAAACGTPPIIPAVYGFGDINTKIKNQIGELGGIPDVFLDKNFLPYLINSIYKTLLLPTKDYQFRQKIANFIKKEFSWENTAKKYLQLLEK